MPNANNKGADEPAHPRRLISVFVVRYLDTCSIIHFVSISKISSLWLVSVAEQSGLRLPWSQTPKKGFPVTRLKWSFCQSALLHILGLICLSHTKHIRLWLSYLFKQLSIRQCYLVQRCKTYFQLQRGNLLCIQQQTSLCLDYTNMF